MIVSSTERDGREYDMDNQQQINWFPGHMAKGLRECAERLSQVDLVLETCDARLPQSSRNPEIDRLIAGKPRLLLMTKADLADPQMTDRWCDWYRRQGIQPIRLITPKSQGIQELHQEIQRITQAFQEKARSKGKQAYQVRAMVLGIPNTGKSSLINALAQRKAAKIENRPGVTRSATWIKGGENLLLMDMPGLLWPKLGTPRRQLVLAASGAIRDEILERESLAYRAFKHFLQRYPEELLERFRLDEDDIYYFGEDLYALYEEAARHRGCLQSGGRIDLDRWSRLFLQELRDGKVGRFTYEDPEEWEKEIELINSEPFSSENP